MRAPVTPRPQRLRPVVPAVLALGSNLGDREATIREAIAEIDGTAGVTVAAASSLVQTPAIKPAGVDRSAPRYLNAVVTIRTVLTPQDLLDALHRIESRHGRLREERWGDRTLDIDIIDIDGRVIEDDRLTLPHPRAWQRAFVLVPWLELDPDAVLTGHGRADALRAAASDEVRPYAGTVVTIPAPDEPAPDEPAPDQWGGGR